MNKKLSFYFLPFAIMAVGVVFVIWMVPLMKDGGKHWGKKGLLQNSSKVDGML